MSELIPDDVEGPVVTRPLAEAMPTPGNPVTLAKDPGTGAVTVRLLRADERGGNVVDTTTASAEEERVRLAARLLRTGLVLQEAADAIYRDLEETGGWSPYDVQRHAANVRRQCPAVAMLPAPSGRSANLDTSGDA